MKRRIIVLVAIVLIGLVPGGRSGAASDPLPTTVMSFNIRCGNADDGPDSWPYRRDLVRSTLEDRQPAVFGVQECLWFQGEYLREAFPAYDMIGHGRDDGEQSGEMCAIFSRGDRFRVLDRGVFWLSETPQEAGSKGWDAALPRIATWVKLQDVSCVAGTLFVFNTHFDHVGQEARANSAVLLGRKMAAIAAGSPIILLGDFNDAATAASPSYVTLTTPLAAGGLGLLDTWHQASRDERMHGEGTFHGFNGEVTRGRIDWILGAPDLPAIDAGIERRGWEGRYPSDHFPVWATFLLPTCTE